MRIVKSAGPAGSTNGLSFFDANGNLILGSNVTFPSAATAYLSNNSGNLYENAPTGKVFVIRVGGANAIEFNALGVSYYSGINTAGKGVAPIYASYSTSANAAAVTNAINYTPPATAGRYRISWVFYTNTATTEIFTVVVTWKNATGTARSQNSGGFDKNGTSLAAGAITNVIGAGAYYGSMMIDIDNSATAITVSTAGTFTTVAYNFSAILEQLA